MSFRNIFSPATATSAAILAVALAFGCVHSGGLQASGEASNGETSSKMTPQDEDASPSDGALKSSSAGEISGEESAPSGKVSVESIESAQGPMTFDETAQNRRARLAWLTSEKGILEISEVIEDDIEDGIEDDFDEAEEEPTDLATLADGECAPQEDRALNGSPVRPGVRYTSDIEDEELAALWKEAPEKLGALSIGLPSIGRVVNAKPFPKNDAWTIVNPSRTYATEETILYVTAAIAEVNREFPEGSLIRINDIGMPNGGYLQPHQSHQAGRDVDLSFYYGTNGPDRGPWAVTNNFDLERNWALIKAFITQTDVQLILVDRSIIQRLRTFAEKKKGEDKAWLDSIFNGGNRALIRHAKGHRDHFHIRLYNPRAQELGRRVLPLMPKDPRQNVRYHKVSKGDTLGKIAFSFGSTIRAIQEANHLKGTLIRLGETLAVPMRGPCVHCPLPPEVIIPPRRLPPESNKPLLAQSYRGRCKAADEADANHSFGKEAIPLTSGERPIFDLAEFLMPWTNFETGISL